MNKRVDEESRKNKHLNAFERGRIEALHGEGKTAYRIGKMLGRSPQTIRNEIRRGTVTILIAGGAFEKTKYYPETGQTVYENNRKHCRVPMKAKTCGKFLAYMEEQVLWKKRSFDAARGAALRNKLFTKDEVVCVTTLYTYADRGIIGVRNIDLPEKVQRKTKKKPVIRKHKRLMGRSIEERPKAVSENKEFGHWEIDLIIGKKSGDSALLTFTEKKTKEEIIEKIGGKSVAEVNKALKRIQSNTPNFEKVFKTITSDNGTEFSRLYELERDNTTKVYYAHPYSSWERGLNESTNRIIRRFIPKGRYIKNYSVQKIKGIEAWINTLPRRILNYATAEECYQEEIAKLVS